MPKKPKPSPLSDKDKQALVDDPDLAKKIETIADGLFKARFADEVGKVKEKIEGKLNVLTTVLIFGTILVLLGLWWQTKAFMDSYQQHYLDTQANYDERVSAQQKEILDLKLDVIRQVNEVKQENEYLRRLLMERGVQLIPPAQTAPANPGP